MGAVITELADTKPIIAQDNLNIDSGKQFNRIMVGVSGNVVLRDRHKNKHRMPNLVAGGWHMTVPYIGVELTGTSATDMQAGATFTIKQ